MQGENGWGYTREPPHQEMDRKALQTPTPPGLEEEKMSREESQRKTIEQTGEKTGMKEWKKSK